MIPWLVAAGVGALLVAAFWDEIVDWLKELTSKIANLFRNIGHAAKIFAQKVRGRILKILHTLFYKENNKWIKETTRAEVDESEVPAWAKAGVRSNETDVTDTYKQELSLAM
ncbi:MAG: hypothetical protein IK062_06565 [Selenomonadaceae bacterium]|nr:hypothetical protein [Selenomonadaceae bacterium]